jgi:hypothetical protein
MTAETSARKRPFVATVLAIAAALAGVLAVVHTLQALAILPFVIGPFTVRGFSLFYALMWGLMAWIWFWLTQMLWRVEPSAWLFLAAISTINLVLAFAVTLGDETWSDVSATFILNGLILLYCMLPGTRRPSARTRCGSPERFVSRRRGSTKRAGRTLMPAGPRSRLASSAWPRCSCCAA